jgi:hypothetical protein
MTFTKRLREGVRRGEITCSVRIWTRPHVRVGARYRMEEGEIQVDSIDPIGFPDITPELARESGFLGVLDLLKVAKHGVDCHKRSTAHGRSIKWYSSFIPFSKERMGCFLNFLNLIRARHHHVPQQLTLGIAWSRRMR